MESVEVRVATVDLAVVVLLALQVLAAVDIPVVEVQLTVIMEPVPMVVVVVVPTMLVPTHKIPPVGMLAMVMSQSNDCKFYRTSDVFLRMSDELFCLFDQTSYFGVVPRINLLGNGFCLF